MTDKHTLVVGASPNPDRYSYKAVVRLRQNNHPVYALGWRNGSIDEVAITKQWPDNHSIHTVTLYLGPPRQPEFYQRIISLQPKRVIFNPGTENPTFQAMLHNENIEVLEACTLVMLSIGNY